MDRASHPTLKNTHGLVTKWSGRNPGEIWYVGYDHTLLGDNYDENSCGVEGCLHYGPNVSVYTTETELSPEEIAVLRLQGKMCLG